MLELDAYAFEYRMGNSDGGIIFQLNKHYKKMIYEWERIRNRNQ